MDNQEIEESFRNYNDFISRRKNSKLLTKFLLINKVSKYEKALKPEKRYLTFKLIDF